MKKSNLGQYYTPSSVSELMCSLSSKLIENPKRIADLSCGDGALLKPMHKMWPESEVFAFDVDKKNILKVKSQYESWCLQKVNSLEFDFQKYKFDISVGNPPFITTRITEKMKVILEKAFDQMSPTVGSTIRAEIVFIAQYLEATSLNGVVSLIVPESIISHEKMRFVRNFLFSNLSHMSIYDLQLKNFDSAEVRTFLITGKKTLLVDDNLEIGTITETGELSTLGKIKKESALDRADVNYHLQIGRINELRRKFKPMRELIQSIHRGVKSKKELEFENAIFFHSTTFKEVESLSNTHLQGDQKLAENYSDRYVAKKNDILVSRIGRNFYKHQAHISNGSAVITDCVYRINTSSKHSQKIFDSLASEDGQMWREVHAKGSCSKLLTIKDLMNLPLTKFPY